ncbi:hypothetical protein HMPREF0653_02670 [Prevotella disiens JCM 6334 = ATCC 29426]|uniref:Uncharacterized protein n=1 Tax=Prevotella disiens JCM 6334 = ATCC 29426 TaxID=1235811 RepID=A0ABN0NNK0_9BACT|nr:hypothetical protein HMPREF0653_02670 [Prevotella disiens JCM 6334 = ATCC 29426]
MTIIQIPSDKNSFKTERLSCYFPIIPAFLSSSSFSYYNYNLADDFSIHHYNL